MMGMVQRRGRAVNADQNKLCKDNMWKLNILSWVELSCLTEHLMLPRIFVVYHPEFLVCEMGGYINWFLKIK